MKQLRVQVLERIIKHMIHGEKDRADKLMEKLMAAVGSMIVNESNYANDDDPMFPARRELQRELEDDIELDRVDAEDEPVADGEPVPADGEGCEDEACSAEEVGKMISDLIASGEIDDETLGQIVDLVVAAQDNAEGLEGEDVPAEDEAPVDDAAGEEMLPADELPDEDGVEPEVKPELTR